MENTIFCQIASYKDPQLIPTMLDMIQNAEHKQNLHICVNWQHGDDETIEDFLDEGFDIQEAFPSETDFDKFILSKDGALISLIDVPFMDSKGACWARNKIQQEYNDEKYTLQLDSHHRFIENWDSVLVEMLESLRPESPKPLLTAYVPSFDPENDPAGRVQAPWRMDFDRFIPEGAVFFLPATIDDWRTRTKPVRARFYSAHFAFADGAFATEVQHDPEYFFHGEEISIGVRAFTHGYDLYHPHETICWHEYTRKGRTKVWDDHTNENKIKGQIDLHWVERNDICHNRNRILFGMDGEDPNQIDFGKYGFGNVRTLEDFERYAGMSFKKRAVTQYTLDKKYPVIPWEVVPEQEFEASLTRSNDIRICVHTNEIKVENQIPDDFDFWYVGAHDAEGKEIYRKDYTQPEINEYVKNEWIDRRFIFLSNHIPKTYTVWPHSKSKGWLNKITKNVD
jgi:hypothetical protein